MNAALAALLLGGGGGGPPRGGGAGQGREEPEQPVEGGRVSDGPALTPFIRAAVEAARDRPSSFASLRNL
eukprot:4392939-Pleurochrysis_carterae.AAC.1